MYTRLLSFFSAKKQLWLRFLRKLCFSIRAALRPGAQCFRRPGLTVSSKPFFFGESVILGEGLGATAPL